MFLVLGQVFLFKDKCFSFRTSVLRLGQMFKVRKSVC